jgi:hypothetical protein
LAASEEGLSSMSEWVFEEFIIQVGVKIFSTLNLSYITSQFRIVTVFAAVDL